MRKVTFEALTRTALLTFDALFAELFPLPAEKRARWSTPDALSELVIGFEQEKYFLRWAAGALTDGGRRSTNYIGPVYGRYVHAALTMPEVPPEYAEEYEDPDDAAEYWFDAWHEVLGRLHVLAGGLALLHFVRRTDRPIALAEACDLRISNDLEDTYSVLTCDQLLKIDDDEGRFKAAVLDGLFEKQLTRRWLERLIATPGEVTIPVLQALEAEFPLEEMLRDVAPVTDEPEENPLKAILKGVR